MSATTLSVTVSMTSRPRWRHFNVKDQIAVADRNSMSFFHRSVLTIGLSLLLMAIRSGTPSAPIVRLKNFRAAAVSRRSYNIKFWVGQSRPTAQVSLLALIANKELGPPARFRALPDRHGTVVVAC